jgi:hypothetical protein
LAVVMRVAVGIAVAMLRMDVRVYGKSKLQQVKAAASQSCSKSMRPRDRNCA